MTTRRGARGGGATDQRRVGAGREATMRRTSGDGTADGDGAAAATRRRAAWRGARGSQARAAEEGENRARDHVEHLECNEQCHFLFNPILVYPLYKFHSINPNFYINEPR
ncbi:hypothetical protein [Oryza sativa Japonica Group]|uniref:Uncharacterized protein n=1 Tax=Oryza sativa subsp. japonica TaxID=39947 RepID=Q5N8J2_ORYSJ|nr:hypothetical protein [Oryza sativa Japonica Group]BAD82226.1 hypothetical protein [Oryza sativa Japonica Group]